jgi:capsular polysaccharide export protein
LIKFGYFRDNALYSPNIAQMLPPQLAGWLQFAGKNVLLLQGPHGPFFSRVAQGLMTAGARGVEKINFNGGDYFFYPSNAHNFTGHLADWPDYLARFIQKYAIDCIFIFGDCRPIHRLAKSVAIQLDVQFWVFEEGYVRPNFITLEQYGVNANSGLPINRHDYDAWPILELRKEVQVTSNFSFAARYAMKYFAAATFFWPIFWRYSHHRDLTVLDGFRWVRSFFRKIHYRAKEASVLQDLKPQGRGKFFLTVLQVALDAQVTVHSPFSSIADFITDTVVSFARHAPDDTVLLIKHHPLDRGYSDYSKLIDNLLRKWNLHGRVRYIHDQYLPALLQHAHGVVTINSTVGFSALSHGTPVITMGKAIYNIHGLTCQAGLEVFWRDPQAFRPDPVLHAKFRNYVTAHTQINGSFYVNVPDSDAAGLRWPKMSNRLITQEA